ncbi:MAG: glycosyltransferase family 4 protein [Actinobacteria bacterium]|nr:glycosyltransferase family 4 protein [Actinomycetota bacterium]
MKVGINAEPLFQRVPTGVGVYALALCRGLGEIGRSDDIVLFHGSHERVPRAVARLPMERCSFGLDRDALYRSWREALRPAPQSVCGDLDVIHAPGPAIPPRGGARLVATIHDLAPLRFPERYSAQARVSLKRGALLAVREAERVVVPSWATAVEVEALLDLDPARLRVVPHGVDLPADAGDDQDAIDELAQRGIRPPYLLWVGTQEQRKNVHAVLDVMSGVGGGHPELSLVLHGPNGWLGSEVAEGIQRRGLTDRTVVSEGSLSRRLLATLYARATVFVFPSLYEGFGLPVLEAMACGAPVVTSNQSALPECVGDAGLLVDPLDHDAVTAAVGLLLDDDGLAKELADAGRNRASTFTWAETARKTWDVYEELASP